LLVSSLYVSGCSETGETPEPKPALEATLYGSSYFNWNSQGRFLTITTTDTWSITFTYPAGAPAGWCSTTSFSGTGNKNVWISTTTNNAIEIRYATIVVATATENVSIEISQHSINDALPYGLKNHLELPKIENSEWLLNYEAGEFTIE
jgi:hypothetical protein